MGANRRRLLPSYRRYQARGDCLMPATLGLTLNGTPHRVHPFALTQSRGGVTSQAKSVLRGGAVLKNQPVSQPARLARKVQRQSGIVQGTTRGGARMNLTARQDGGYYYRQLRAIDELRLTTVTPGDRVKYEQAFARLRATDKLKKGQTPPPPGTLFSSHPYVGLHPAAEFAASQATQVRQAFKHGLRKPTGTVFRPSTRKPSRATRTTTGAPRRCASRYPTTAGTKLSARCGNRTDSVWPACSSTRNARPPVPRNGIASTRRRGHDRNSCPRRAHYSQHARVRYVRACVFVETVRALRHVRHRP